MSVPKGNIPWNKGVRTGLIPRTAFHSGHRPWNKNLSVHLSPATEFKKGIVPWNKGKPLSQSHRKRLCKPRPSTVGEKHHNWRGGWGKLRNILRHRHSYKQWRRNVFNRDNWTCCWCFKRGGHLEAHHVREFKTIKDLCNLHTIDDALSCSELWEIENGITLCVNCHNKTKGAHVQV